MIERGMKLEDYIKCISNYTYEISELKVNNGVLEKDIETACKNAGEKLIKDRSVVLAKIRELKREINKLNRKIFKKENFDKLISEKAEQIKQYEQQENELTKKIVYICAFCAKYFQYEYAYDTYFIYIDNDATKTLEDKIKFNQASDKIWEMFLEVCKDEIDKKLNSVRKTEKKVASQQRNIDDMLDKTL